MLKLFNYLKVSFVILVTLNNILYCEPDLNVTFLAMNFPIHGRCPVGGGGCDVRASEWTASLRALGHNTGNITTYSLSANQYVHGAGNGWNFHTAAMIDHPTGKLVYDRVWFPDGFVTPETWLKAVGGYAVIHDPMHPTVLIDGLKQYNHFNGIDSPGKPTTLLPTDGVIPDVRGPYSRYELTHTDLKSFNRITVGNPMPLPVISVTANHIPLTLAEPDPFMPGLRFSGAHTPNSFPSPKLSKPAAHIPGGIKGPLILGLVLSNDIVQWGLAEVPCIQTISLIGSGADPLSCVGIKDFSWGFSVDTGLHVNATWPTPQERFSNPTTLPDYGFRMQLAVMTGDSNFINFMLNDSINKILEQTGLPKELPTLPTVQKVIEAIPVIIEAVPTPPILKPIKENVSPTLLQHALSWLISNSSIELDDNEIYSSAAVSGVPLDIPEAIELTEFDFSDEDPSPVPSPSPTAFGESNEF